MRAGLRLHEGDKAPQMFKANVVVSVGRGAWKLEDLITLPEALGEGSSCCGITKQEKSGSLSIGAHWKRMIVRNDAKQYRDE